MKITGQSFNFGPMHVFFGGDDHLGEINFVSEKGDVIVCQTPSSPPGKVWVEVSNGRGRVRYEGSQYEYVLRQEGPEGHKVANSYSALCDLNEDDTAPGTTYEFKDFDLFSAAAYGMTDVIPDFSSSGSVNACDSCGATALFWAVWALHHETVKALLDNGADPNIPTHGGETPLHIAADVGDKEMVELLVSYCADISAKNNDQETPLFYGADHPHIVKYLKEKGADVNVQNVKGETWKDWKTQQSKSESTNTKTLNPNVLANTSTNTTSNTSPSTSNMSMSDPSKSSSKSLKQSQTKASKSAKQSKTKASPKVSRLQSITKKWKVGGTRSKSKSQLLDDITILKFDKSTHYPLRPTSSFERPRAPQRRAQTQKFPGQVLAQERLDLYAQGRLRIVSNKTIGY